MAVQDTTVGKVDEQTLSLKGPSSSASGKTRKSDDADDLDDVLGWDARGMRISTADGEGNDDVDAKKKKAAPTPNAYPNPNPRHSPALQRPR